ncbi:MAG: hypothetical protein FWG60_04730 [Methanomassiliicoccaceae archaeon]|nr:hypothetical protein [Methanomassiliicoccaceae archaeon]
MAVGVLSVAAGSMIYFTSNKTAGVLLLIIGVSLFVITFSISNVFFKINMIETMENRKKMR